MRLLLARHGRTIENEKGIIQGHLPGTLSEEGEAQARNLAKSLKGEHFDAIYSSDLKRAVDTAKEITKYHKEVPFIQQEILREIDHGAASGKTEQEAKGIPSAESAEDIYARANHALHSLFTAHPNDTILVVSHQAFNSAIEAVLAGLDPSQSLDLATQENATVREFELKKFPNKKESR